MAKLAVYGTLRKGCSLNYYLKSSTYIGKFRIEGFNLYMSRYIPFVEKGDGKVTVEVYKVTEALIRTLDILEGVYNRIPAKIGKHDVFIYTGKPFLKDNSIKIESGDYKEQ